MDVTMDWVARATGGVLVGVAGAAPVGSVAIDSRNAGPGVLFVALPGSRCDGHDFAARAVEAGAVGVLASRSVDAPHILVADTVQALGDLARAYLVRLRGPRRLTGRDDVVPASAGGVAHPRVVAITGSVGKTTTKDLLARICAAMGPTVAAKGSFNNHLGLPLTILAATADTEFLVLELGANHRGEIAALTRIAPPDVGIVLGVAPAHLGEFGSIDAIAAAKAELPAALPARGIAVLAADDPRVTRMPTPARVWTFGADAAAQVRATGVSTDDAGHLTVCLDTPAGSAHIVTRLVGTHHAANVLAATAGALALGATPGLIERALTGVGPDSPHRMALHNLGRGVRLLDDAYNANPVSSAQALRFAAALAGRSGARTWAVLGEMAELGPAGPDAHLELGSLAAELGVDRLIAVGAGARGIGLGAIGAGLASRAVEFCETPLTAGELGLASARDVVVLIKGSHSTGLWRLADALTAPDPAARPEPAHATARAPRDTPAPTPTAPGRAVPPC
jgi:UDP-N-acetylmuramoyl-tripeptide--D-alanyl-D-alanine ligase